MRFFLSILFSLLFFQNILQAQTESLIYEIDLEQISMPGSPMIHSFAFAEANGKWLFVGGRINGLHGFTPINSFPKQFSNINFYVVDPSTAQTWSRNIFADLPVNIADPLRSTNMQSVQSGNKLYMTGGFGYDSASNEFITFPVLTVIDVSEIIQAITAGSPVTSFVRQISDSRFQVTGGEMLKLGDYFYLVGGHNFSGAYRRTVNVQVYTNQIKKFRIDDNGVSTSIFDYSAITDTVEFHRRDMNLVPVIKPDGVTPAMVLTGGVFKQGRDLPYLNPIYIDENGATVDYSFEQKMNQYTCPFMPVYSSATHSMHVTLFGGMSLYYHDENLDTLVYDSLIPFVKDIVTITRYSNGLSDEKILPVKFPELLGTNAEFILSETIPHFDNGVIKLNELTGRAFAGYIFGGIRALMPNNGNSYPSGYVFKVYITPEEFLPVELISFTYSVHNRNVLLKWSTSAEIDNSGFEVQRKDKSSENWEYISFINGYGNTNIIHNYYYEDKNLSSRAYNYRLKQTDFNGNFKYHNLNGEINIGTPENFSLSQNYPNPFNPVTKINYSIPKTQFTLLKVYDASGKEIVTLVNEIMQAGYYETEFDGSNYSSGIYFYELRTSEFSETKKMFLLK